MRVPVLRSVTLAFAFLTLAVAASADAPSSWRAVLGGLSATPFPPSGSSRAIYDPFHDRVVVLTGLAEPNRLLAWTPSGGGRWSHLSASGPAPSVRVASSFVLDAARHRAILFGGQDARTFEFLNDVWALSLDEPTTWTQLVTNGAAPLGRIGHAAAIDSVRDRMIVHGGLDHATSADAVWALLLRTDPPVWTELPVAPATLTWGQAMILDPVADRIIEYGGYGREGGQLAALSLSHPESGWYPAGDLHAPADFDSAARAGGTLGVTGTYDPVHDRMLLFGGLDYWGARHGDGWAVALRRSNDWSHFGRTDIVGRQDQAAAYDPVRDQLVLAGGGPGIGTSIPVGDNDAWLVDGKSLSITRSWPPEPEAQPVPRAFAWLVDDPDSRRLILAGGSAGTPVTHALWSLSLDDPPVWTALPESPAPAASYQLHSPLLHDRARHRVVGLEWPSRLWSLSLEGTPSWSAAAISGPTPTAAGTVVFDATHDRLLSYGGFIRTPPSRLDQGYTVGEVWELPLSSLEWHLLAPSGTPPPTRAAHHEIFDPTRGRLLTWGGFTRPDRYAPGTPLADLWMLDVSQDPPVWSELASSGVADVVRDVFFDAARDRALGVAADGRTWKLDLAHPSQWTALDVTNPGVLAREGHAVAFDAVGDRVVVFGGNPTGNYGEYLGDVWELKQDPATPTEVALVSATVTNDHVEISWQLPYAAGTPATIERSALGGEWTSLATISSDGDGRVAYVDREVVSGARYGYRLVVRGDVSIATWVDVPRVSSFSLAGAMPNPGPRRPLVVFSLPDAEPARLEWFDLAGRRLGARDVGALGAGEHRLRLDLALAPGVYLVRLARATESRTSRVAIVE